MWLSVELPTFACAVTLLGSKPGACSVITPSLELPCGQKARSWHAPSPIPFNRGRLFEWRHLLRPKHNKEEEKHTCRRGFNQFFSYAKWCWWSCIIIYFNNFIRRGTWEAAFFRVRPLIYLGQYCLLRHEMTLRGHRLESFTPLSTREPWRPETKPRTFWSQKALIVGVKPILPPYKQKQGKGHGHKCHI